jgi:hypothetical protein
VSEYLQDRSYYIDSTLAIYITGGKFYISFLFIFLFIYFYYH